MSELVHFGLSVFSLCVAGCLVPHVRPQGGAKVGHFQTQHSVALIKCKFNIYIFKMGQDNLLSVSQRGRLHYEAAEGIVNTEVIQK